MLLTKLWGSFLSATANHKAAIAGGVDASEHEKRVEEMAKHMRIFMASCSHPLHVFLTSRDVLRAIHYGLNENLAHLFKYMSAAGKTAVRFWKQMEPFVADPAHSDLIACFGKVYEKIPVNYDARTFLDIFEAMLDERGRRLLRLGVMTLVENEKLSWSVRLCLVSWLRRKP